MNAPATRRRIAAPKAEDWAFAGLLLVLVLIFLRALLNPGTVYSSYDFARDIYPSFHWLHVRYSAGAGVFWDQSSGLGDPIFDSGRSFLFYFPLRCILTFFDAVPAVALCLILHYYLAALGTFCLARVHGCSAPASFVAAVAVAFSGGMVDSCSSVGLLMPLAWFPWMILGLKWLQASEEEGPWGRRAPAGAAVLGLSTGLAFLAGHIGMALCQIYALAVLHLVFCLAGPGRRRRLAASLPALLTAASIGVLLYAGQALGLERLASQAGRGSAYTLAQAAEGAMNPVSLFQLFLPHLLGRLQDATFLGQSWVFGTNDPQGIVLYMGIPAFVAAVFFIVSAPRREILPWAAAWIFLVLYALGTWTPFFGLYYHLPLLGHLHWAVRAACQCAPLLAVPVALGVDRMSAQAKAWPGRLALGLGCALLLLSLGLKVAEPWLEAAGRRFVFGHIVGSGLHAYAPSFYLDKLTRWLAATRVHVAAQGLWALATGLWLRALVRLRPGARRAWMMAGLGLLAFAELNANLADYNPTLPRAVLTQKPPSAEKILALEGGPDSATQPFRCLVWGFGAQLRRSFPDGRFFGDVEGERRNNALLPPALNKFYGFDLVNAYPSAGILRLEPFTGISWFRDLNMDPPQPSSDLLLHKRLYDLCGAKYFVLGAPLASPGLKPLMTDPVYLYRNEGALPLAFVAGRYSGGWTFAGAVAALTDTASAQSHWERPALVEAAVGSGQGRGQVRWLRREDLEWDLDVDKAGAGPGMLVLSRLYYPGPWKAQVNGRPAELLAADGALCALRLDAGASRVRVYYDDPLPARGLGLEVLGGALAALLLLLALRRGPSYDLSPRRPSAPGRP